MSRTFTKLIALLLVLVLMAGCGSGKEPEGEESAKPAVAATMKADKNADAEYYQELKAEYQKYVEISDKIDELLGDEEEEPEPTKDKNKGKGTGAKPTKAPDETSEDIDEIEDMVKNIHSLSGDLDECIEAMSGLAEGKTPELVNLRGKLISHMRIEQYLLDEYVGIMEYLGEVINISNEIGVAMDSTASLVLFQEKLAAYIKVQPPDNFAQFHSNFVNILNRMNNAIIAANTAAALNDSIRALSATEAIESLVMDITGVMEGMDTYFTFVGDKIDGITEIMVEKRAEFKDEFDTLDKKYGAKEG